MDFVPVELPSLRIPLSRETLELVNAALYVFVAGKVVEIIAHRLIQALSHDAGPYSSSLDDVLIGGKGNIHAHSMRVPIPRVNLRSGIFRLTVQVRLSGKLEERSIGTHCRLRRMAGIPRLLRHFITSRVSPVPREGPGTPSEWFGKLSGPEQPRPDSWQVRSYWSDSS